MTRPARPRRRRTSTIRTRRRRLATTTRRRRRRRVRGAPAREQPRPAGRSSSCSSCSSCSSLLVGRRRRCTCAASSTRRCRPATRSGWPSRPARRTATSPAARGRGRHRRRPGFRVLPAVQGRRGLPGRRLRVPGELGGLGRPRRARGRSRCRRSRSPFTVPEGLTIAEYPGRDRRRRRRLRRRARIAELLATGQVRPAGAAPGGHRARGLPVPRHVPGRGGHGRAAALNRMAAQFDAVAAEVGLVERAAALGLHALRDRRSSPR